MTQQDYLKVLERIVNIHSKTMDKQAVNKVNDILARQYQKLGFTVKRYTHPKRGDLVVAKYWKHKNAPNVLLSGHTDVVPFHTINKFKVANGKCYGNGVSDMKAGLVVMLGIAEQVAKNNIPVNLTCALTPDEEHGSVNHRKQADKVFKGHDYGFVFEVGKNIGGASWAKNLQIVTQRKSVTALKIKTFGSGGHAGNQIHNRDNAIEEMAEKIIKIRGLMDPKKGITTNAGTIKGGAAQNVIAPLCRLWVDVRTLTTVSQNSIINKIMKIADKNIYTKKKSSCSIEIYMPPLEFTPAAKKLFRITEQCANDMGIAVSQVERGGGSDANHISGAGVPVIDGFGATGDTTLVHTEHEWVYTKSIFRSIDIVSNVLMKLSV